MRGESLVDAEVVEAEGEGLAPEAAPDDPEPWLQWAQPHGILSPPAPPAPLRGLNPRLRRSKVSPRPHLRPQGTCACDRALIPPAFMGEIFLQTNNPGSIFNRLLFFNTRVFLACTTFREP